MGTSLGLPGCLLTFLGLVTIVVGVSHGSALGLFGGLAVLAVGLLAWIAAARADVRRHRDG